MNRTTAARRNRKPRPSTSGQHRRSHNDRKQGRAPQRSDFALPVTTTPPLPAVHAFADMGLPEPLSAKLAELGMEQPFPIQAATLPNSLAGRDVLGRGRTGSGKTLAFGLSVLSRLSGRTASPHQPLAVVLVPTRELAQQVTGALSPYARAARLRISTVVGGLPIGRQAGALRRGTEVVVATPGRLADLLERGDCRLDRVEISVLDEADQMTDMGFMPQVTHLLDRTLPHGQRMLFSATLDRNVDRLVRRYLHDPVVHSVDPSAGAVATMEHHVLHIGEDDKRATVTRIAAREGRVIMFLDTKRAVDRLVSHLLANGVPAGGLHGGKSQSQRTRTLEQFKDGRATVLVATNVAARGIDIADLDLVVNVDPPQDHKDYLHRGGRTARAGAGGSVVSLILPHQRRAMSRLLSTAEITASTRSVHSDGADLSRVTGARAPSGVPVTVPAPVGRQSGAPRGRRRNGNRGSARRRAA
ncbi:DEAD/DEAH box helicase [Nocardiopsis kunsanensis]|uniref:DEAD/DEAH box helicase n=1 Tax=Nocardiopsis kunsanensis TaxID=141693 RepID=A0A919CEI4_9ACTN|nr:DEAD/DEAH box helicase [Nocardiopsis kunsanensis]GHD15752.1 DEAD/DEAH box helicase [Nocardiopsis kunsanensis]